MACIHLEFNDKTWICRGERKRDGGARDEKKGSESGKAVKQAEKTVKGKNGEVVKNMGAEIDLEEARREEESYWKEFAALKFDEEDDD